MRWLTGTKRAENALYFQGIAVATSGLQNVLERSWANMEIIGEF